MKVTYMDGTQTNMITSTYNAMKSAAYQRGVMGGTPKEWKFTFEQEYFDKGVQDANRN